MSATSVNYPTQTIDSFWGTTQQFKLYTINGIKAYVISINPGTLSGGSSPAWTISGTNPAITHITVKANNNPILDADTITLFERNANLMHISPDGLNYLIPLALPYYKGGYLPNTEFPSFEYTDVELVLTFAPLSQITSGSPTGSSGTEMNYSEDYILRQLVDTKKLLRPRVFQYSTILNNVNSYNDLTSFLPQVGTYQSIQLFASTNLTSPYSGGSNTAITNVELLLNQVNKPLSTNFNLLRLQNAAAFGRSQDTGFATIQFSYGTSGLVTSDLNALKNLDLRVFNNTSSPVYLNALATIFV
ncbi:MAG: hypothetical protein QW726_06235 [Fervidicoccaceae archaeon]